MSIDAAKHISVFTTINPSLFSSEQSAMVLPKYPAFHAAQRAAFFAAYDTSKLPAIFAPISTTNHGAECSPYFAAFRSS